VKIYVAGVKRSGKRREGMKLSLPPKLVEKLVWGPSFVKNFIPSQAFEYSITPKLAVVAP
jgi:hypothetical protein